MSVPAVGVSEPAAGVNLPAAGVNVPAATPGRRRFAALTAAAAPA
ncbi:hypothetical protein [Streptomyces hoynatensis]|nr:hypothetical protein [Streptomyces hoynatensis]